MQFRFRIIYLKHFYFVFRGEKNISNVAEDYQVTASFFN